VIRIFACISELPRQVKPWNFGDGFGEFLDYRSIEQRQFLEIYQYYALFWFSLGWLFTCKWIWLTRRKECFALNNRSKCRCGIVSKMCSNLKTGAVSIPLSDFVTCLLNLQVLECLKNKKAEKLILSFLCLKVHTKECHQFTSASLSS